MLFQHFLCSFFCIFCIGKHIDHGINSGSFITQNAIPESFFSFLSIVRVFIVIHNADMDFFVFIFHGCFRCLTSSIVIIGSDPAADRIAVHVAVDDHNLDPFACRIIDRIGICLIIYRRKNNDFRSVFHCLCNHLILCLIIFFAFRSLESQIQIACRCSIARPCIYRFPESGNG